MPDRNTDKNTDKNKNNNNSFNWVRLLVTLFVIAILILLILYLSGVFSEYAGSKTMNIQELKQKLTAKEVEKWWFQEMGGSSTKFFIEDTNEKVYVLTLPEESASNTFSVINGSYISTASPGDAPKIPYTGGMPVDDLLALDNSQVKQTWIPIARPSLFTNIITSLIPMLFFIALLIGVYMFIGKRMGGLGGGMQSTMRNQAVRIFSDKKFSDIAGQKEVKEEVLEVVDFLKHPAKYRAAGARVPKGILLGGPPGTGKTLMAKAVAGEADVPFFFISASNFVELYVGLGAKRVREMFKEARKNTPSILFIDELDAIGKRRSTQTSNDEREGTLNQILVEMDGMDENSGLLIIAATNMPESLDPALLRPGRFDRTITIALPDIKEREAILELHAKGKRISPEINFKNIAKRIPRFSGAQIEAIINEAALLSVREGTRLITLSQIDEAIDRVSAGPARKNRVITARENRVVAVHEAGHAVIGLKVEDADIVQKITIIPRGNAGGYTLFTPKEETYNYTKSQLLSKIMGLLGGRASEQVIYGEGEVSTGASNDIERATAIARAMVTQYGMSSLGPIAYERDTGPQFLGSTDKLKDYSDALAERIDEAIRQIIMHAEKKAIKVIEQNMKLLDLIVEELLEKETIVLEEINYINKNLKRPPKKKEPKKTKNEKTLSQIISDVELEEKDQKINLETKKTKSSTPKKTVNKRPKTKTTSEKNKKEDKNK